MIRKTVSFIGSQCSQIKNGGLPVLRQKLRGRWHLFLGLSISTLCSGFYERKVSKSLGIPNGVNILFSHASVSDTFITASFLDNFAHRYGKTHVIASIIDKEIYRIYCKNPELVFIFLEEETCKGLRAYLSKFGTYKKLPRRTEAIRPTHLVMYDNIESLTVAGILDYRDALMWVLGLDLNQVFKYPSYSENDRSEAIRIMNGTGYDLTSIALINPICYTHDPLSLSQWQGVANALLTSGFQVVFNIQGNTGSQERFILPLNCKSVAVPRHLVPLIASMIGLGCARHGGGFDLLHAYSKESKCILFRLEGKTIPSGRKEDPVEDSARFYEKFCDKTPSRVVTLESGGSESSAYDEMLNAVRAVRGSLIAK